MDRDRVSALLASKGDEPEWQVCRDLLGEYDRAVRSRDIWRETAAVTSERADDLAVRLDKVEQDSVRLANHIIAHPANGSERVLDLHEKRYQ